MATGDSTGSKWFWWIMGIVATVVATAIITALHLSGSSSSSLASSHSSPLDGPSSPVTAVDYSGTYGGQALNAGVVGNVQLQVNEGDPASGSTTGKVKWSGNLNGAGPVRGTFADNNITFEGEVNSLEGPWSLTMNCTFSDSSNVTCDYQLQPVAPNTYGPQQGSLTASKS